MPRENSIANLEPAGRVYDNGRRGLPRPGCDCEQCFGYCLIDENKALRDQFSSLGRVAPTRETSNAPLNFED